MSDTLTAGDVLALAKIIRAVDDQGRVHWAAGDGDVCSGTARQLIVAEGDFHIYRGPDIREAYLRVTADTGVEIAMPVRKVVARLRDRDLVFREEL